jgi:hypothetical protein
MSSLTRTHSFLFIWVVRRAAVDAISVPEGVDEDAAYVAKTAAPYDLAAKQSLAIVDYMKDPDASGSVTVSSTKAAAVHRAAKSRAGIMDNKTGSKVIPVYVG